MVKWEELLRGMGELTVSQSPTPTLLHEWHVLFVIPHISSLRFGVYSDTRKRAIDEMFTVLKELLWAMVIDIESNEL